ncbi:MAG: hypothetical protein OEU46_13250 [Alphaproteobacteria bacterium]|nr:hypothetical protein [Alphaproteobacteria bacterium]
MNGVSVGIISQDQFFREGLKTLLSENGYQVVGGVSDHREFDSCVSMADTPVLVLVDLVNDVDAAADQLHYLRDNLPGVTIVAFSDQRNEDWVTICEDYDAGALLRKQVSFKALLHCLELVMIGEKVMPTTFEPSKRHSEDADETDGALAHASGGRQSRGETIPCMTCTQPFETADRKANRICSSCKSKMSRISSASEHTLHY